MKTSFAELKMWAKRALLGNYGTVVGTIFLLYAINLAVSFSITFLTEIWTMLSPRSSSLPQYAAMAGIEVRALVLSTWAFLMRPGFTYLEFKLCSGQRIAVSDLFFAFRKHFGKFFLAAASVGTFMAGLYLPIVVLNQSLVHGLSKEFYLKFLCIYGIMCMAFVIYAVLNYGLFYIILAENPEKSISTALRESRELMQGNRCRRLLLECSFLGWILVGYLTAGIGLLWLSPYMGCSFIQFYQDLKFRAEL